MTKQDTTTDASATSDAAAASAVAMEKALRTGLQATTAYDRPDLGERLERALVSIGDPAVNVVVVGEFKQGKSSLINALLNAKVCAVDDDIATAVPTVVRHGDEQKAWALTKPSDAPADVEATKQQIPFTDVPAFETELGAPLDDVQVTGVEIEIPRRLLDNGLVLIDTPGVGGLGSAHSTAALGALSVANAVVFVSDASQEYTRAEIDFLHQAVELCPHVLCVMTKIDFYPDWRRVKEINQGHLARTGFTVPILPVSSMLRLEAARLKDRQLNEESGFASLVKWLNDDVVANANTREVQSAKNDLLRATDQLEGQFEAELVSLKDPARAAELVDQLEAAKNRSERLRSAVSKWNVTLNDGVSDLNSAVDFDFKGRVRRLQQEADAAIEKSDPIDTWDEFEPWLVNRVSFDVVTNYRYLIERAQELSSKVGEHFEIEGAELNSEFDVHNPMNVLSRVAVEPSFEMDDMGTGQKGMTVLRGSYSGILMFTMLGAMIPGVVAGALTAPGIVVGLLMGRKSLKDEKERQLKQRQSQAKIALRRYTDEVSFQVTKDSRDTLRRVHRQLRDHYSSRAEELHKSTTSSLKAAQEAAKLDQTERTKRIKDVEAELGRIGKLRAMAEAVKVG